jgi:hypothetical protein
VIAAGLYFVQKDYAKTETYLWRALNIDESLFGRDDVDAARQRSYSVRQVGQTRKAGTL